MIEPHLFIFAFQNYIYIYIYITTPPTCSSWSITTAVVKICHRHSPKFCLERNSLVNTMGWNERSDPDMRTANFCDVYREGVYRLQYNIVAQSYVRTQPAGANNLRNHWLNMSSNYMSTLPAIERERYIHKLNLVNLKNMSLHSPSVQIGVTTPPSGQRCLTRTFTRNSSSHQVSQWMILHRILK